jgi:hypothetical protein
MLKKIVKYALVLGVCGFAVAGLAKYDLVERSASACDAGTGAGCG